MIKPIITTQVVLERNTQLHLTTVVQEFYYQVLTIELKTSPKLLYRVVSHHHQRLLLPFLVYAQARLVHHPQAFFPTSKKWTFSHFACDLCSFELLFGQPQFGLDFAKRSFAHKLEFQRYNFGKQIVIVIQAKLIQFFVIYCKEDIFFLIADFHLKVARLSTNKKQLHLCDVV